jgi:phenylpyruvate tautomerase PptA (4-oxalocrotonate tautomerase family)
MTHPVRTSASILAAALLALATPLTASAATAGPSSVDITVDQLQHQGFGVIVDRFGDLQAEQCTIPVVRPQAYVRTADGPVATVMGGTEYVELSC